MSDPRDTEIPTQDRGRRYRQHAAQFRELAEDEAIENLRAKLLDLAASFEETAALLSSEGERKILRARPVQGEIDHAKLSREHIARFPKLDTSNNGAWLRDDPAYWASAVSFGVARGSKPSGSPR